jgi:Tol biopolymer transport system component
MRKYADFVNAGHDGCPAYFDHLAGLPAGNCCNLISRAFTAKDPNNPGIGGGGKFWGVIESFWRKGNCAREHRWDPWPSMFAGDLDSKGHFTSIYELKRQLANWEVPLRDYPLDSLKKSIPEDLKVGDLLFVDRRKDGRDWHVMMVVEIDRQNGNIYYSDHHGSNVVDSKGNVIIPGAGYSDHKPLVPYLKSLGKRGISTNCQIAFMPQNGVIQHCCDWKQIETWDSTAYDRAERKQVTKCCWKEKLGGEAPWNIDPTPYLCLNWERRNGQTHDTLIVPRMNLAGCSCAVVKWASVSNLKHFHIGDSVAVLGSTDDGYSWEVLGDDSTTEVVLPEKYWNNRNVRLAYAYHGYVDSCETYWCVDHIRLLAKPTRDKDVCVSEIHEPFSMAGGVPSLGPGQTITPTAFVWNSGRQVESLPFTFQINDNSTCVYTDTRWMNLCPYFDTCVQFSPWTVPQTPGSFTAVCYADLPDDECSANDTATLTFKVASDTWVKMTDVFYGRGMSEGGCLGTFNTDSIFMGVRKKLFARYWVSRNTWNGSPDAPKNFGNGAALAYPGSGDYLYAIFGASKVFWRYSVSGKYWCQKKLHNTPELIGNGGDLAWGGSSLYALQGRNKQKFFRCDTSPDSSWHYLADTPGRIELGGSLVWDGGDYLYALQGGDSVGFFQYAKYSNQWSRLQPIPAPVGEGGALAYDTVADVVYAFTGNKTCGFYSYNVLQATWTSPNQAPRPIRKGGCLAYCNHSLYGGVGKGVSKKYYTDNFWRYLPPIGGAGGQLSVEAKLAEQAESQPTMGAGVEDNRLDPGEQITFDATNKHTPRYSPNGMWIAYTAEDSASEGTGLYRIPTSGGPFEALGPDSMIFEDPVWSSNGAWLVASARDGIYKLSSGIAPFRLAEGVVGLPQVTANDSWVMYEKWDTIAHSHDVCKVRPNATGETSLTPGTDGYLEPQPISDSEFACVKLRDEAHQVCKVAPGQEMWLTSDYMENSGLLISPDRQWLAYEKVDESGFSQIYKIRVDGTQESRVTDGTCNCETPVFSPNGFYIAYTKWPIDTTSSSDCSQVCYRGVDSGSVEVTLNSPDAERENPSWSPNCAYIIYEKVSESGSPGLGKRAKYKQIGRARTRIKSLTGVEEISGLPRTFALYQNRPNPFGRATTIRYAIPIPSYTELNIYDVAGRTVTRLVQSEQKPGYYSVAWKGTDMRGRSVAAGTYFYVLKANGKIAQKRMLLVR